MTGTESRTLKVGVRVVWIGRYLEFYNGRRPYSSLDGQTPDQVYFNLLPIRMAAYPQQRL
jgi:hypothetical protein